MNPDAPTALASSVKSFAAGARAVRSTGAGEGVEGGGEEDAICPDPFAHRCVSRAAEPGSGASAPGYTSAASCGVVPAVGLMPDSLTHYGQLLPRQPHLDHRLPRGSGDQGARADLHSAAPQA